MRIQLLIFLLLYPFAANAELKVSPIFSDHGIFQAEKKIKIWGWDTPNQEVSVTFEKEKATCTSDSNGYWETYLKERKSTFTAQKLTIEGSSTLSFNNILIGEVWLCSGQSNMEWDLNSIHNSAVEKAAATTPSIRLLKIPRNGQPTPQDTFEGKWEVCNPKTIADFSAVGYFFGKQLSDTLKTPIGLIDNAWGGSSAEAWVSQDALEKLSLNLEEMSNIKHPQLKPSYLYNGLISPIEGYTARGIIWYQGERNTRAPANYDTLFPALINSWREKWSDPELPFYWCQLAGFKKKTKFSKNSSWAQLRQAQTDTLHLKNTGQAILYDLGEENDIHPQNKRTVAMRLVRHALKNNYGFKLIANSPSYQSHRIQENKAILEFKDIGKKLLAYDENSISGFVIADESGNFFNANVKITKDNTIILQSPKVSQPLHIRYAWADNPIANVINNEGLPLTPFATDLRK